MEDIKKQKEHIEWLGKELNNAKMGIPAASSAATNFTLNNKFTPSLGAYSSLKPST